jgi:hypothetical protein
MNDEKKIQLNLAIPERYRNLLRRMAAERVMADPCQVVSGTSIATEILLNETCTSFKVSLNMLRFCQILRPSDPVHTFLPLPPIGLTNCY